MELGWPLQAAAALGAETSLLVVEPQGGGIFALGGALGGGGFHGGVTFALGPLLPWLSHGAGTLALGMTGAGLEGLGAASRGAPPTGAHVGTPKLKDRNENIKRIWRSNMYGLKLKTPLSYL